MRNLFYFYKDRRNYIQVMKNGKYNEATCQACGCVFSFDKIDIEDENKVKCPQCSNPTSVLVKPVQ